MDSMLRNWALNWQRRCTSCIPRTWKLEKMQQLLVNQAFMTRCRRGRILVASAQDWQEELLKFQKVREKYLIYK
jgi:uncharacterized protein YbbC (DUF1343 family)